jgi:hypothetical protein
MKIHITQLGGHLGSFAGDCAMIQISSGFAAYVIVIDTGSSVIWDGGNKDFQRQVENAFRGHPNVHRWLITTHFHDDHFNRTRADMVRWSEWFHGSKRENTPTTGNLISGSQRLLEVKEAHGWSLFLDAYAPDWSSGSAKDENDLSLAIACYASNGFSGFSFLSFGDMTLEGEQRLTMGSIFPADFVKYPHHGSENNYLKYFSYGICKTILISGDSGSAANTAVKLLEGNPGTAIRVLAKTSDAWKQFSESWARKCSLKSSLYGADVQLGRRIDIDWESGVGLWATKPDVKLCEAQSLRVVPVTLGSRNKESPQWVPSIPYERDLLAACALRSWEDPRRG